MHNLFRETAAGQIIRFLYRGRLLQYPEELPGFQFKYPSASEAPTSQPESEAEFADPAGQLARLTDDAAVEKGLAKDEIAIPASVETKAESQFVVIGWYSQDDIANPQNWSSGKKVLVSTVICVYTFTVYLGSAIYAPSVPGVMEEFGCSETVASLGLALYVLGYGVGALLWSPLSEIPVLGRTGIYVVTFFLFTVLLIPTALVQNLAGLLVLRFLLGWFGSPSLATSAAGFSDMFNFLKLPYCLALWASISTMAPAVGPIVAGYSVAAKDWRWSQLELLWLSAPIFLMLLLLLPETSSDTILLRRAARLRMITGNPKLRSASEIKMQHMTAREMAFNSLIRPWEMNILDPAILFTTWYCSLCYAIFYSFFEVFPEVFPKMYYFTAGEVGLAYLGVPIGILVTLPVTLSHYALRVEPRLLSEGFPAPEVWLRPGLYANTLVFAGLFIFAWTARPDIHWIVPIIGIVITQSGSYVILNVLFTYIPNIYPQYAASLFAANNAMRSTLAAAAILFGRPMFSALGVAGGISLLAGLSCLCSVAFFGLYRYGPTLRARSRFLSA